MVAPQREDAEAAQQVEVAPAGDVVEVWALAAREVHVIAEGLQHAHELSVEMLLVERVLLALPPGEDAREVEGHRAPSQSVARRGRAARQSPAFFRRLLFRGRPEHVRAQGWE